MSLPHNSFKVPDWYDPDKNIVRDLDWESGDVFEAWNTITGDKVRCVVGTVSFRVHAVESKHCGRCYFERDGLSGESQLLIDPKSRYEYHEISGFARRNREIQLFDKISVNHRFLRWVVLEIDKRDKTVKATNGFECRWFSFDCITIEESLTLPKTIKEQIKCDLNKIAHTKIMKAITGLFVGLMKVH